MRLKINYTKSTTPIPFNYKELVTGTIYKWLGEYSDDFHGRKYQKLTISDLYGTKEKNNHLVCTNGGYFLISSSDIELMVKLIVGIQNDPSMFSGLEVTEITKVKSPDFEKKWEFKTKSMFFIKDENNNFIYPDNENFSTIIKQKINNKLEYHGLKKDDTVEIIFNPKFNVKMYTYKGTNNKGFIGNFIFLGKPETKEFMYENGLGNSTGIGFGCFE